MERQTSGMTQLTTNTFDMWRVTAKKNKYSMLPSYLIFQGIVIQLSQVSNPRPSHYKPSP
jgi:hypothetical protein